MLLVRMRAVQSSSVSTHAEAVHPHVHVHALLRLGFGSTPVVCIVVTVQHQAYLHGGKPALTQLSLIAPFYLRVDISSAGNVTG
jgi:hypothetical protein